MSETNKAKERNHIVKLMSEFDTLTRLKFETGEDDLYFNKSVYNEAEKFKTSLLGDTGFTPYDRAKGKIFLDMIQSSILNRL